MNKAGLILEKIARMTRAMRLRRHVQAIADAVGVMSQTELLRLRDVIGSIAATAGGDAIESGTEPRSQKPDGVLDALGAISVERQLNSDSTIVRNRYIARWLMQAVHLSVGEEAPNVRAIHRRAVAILRIVQSVSEPSRQRSWFMDNGKKAS